MPLALLALLPIVQDASDSAPPDLAAAEQAAFLAAVERVAPSVVRIETVGGRDTADGRLVGTGPTTGLIVSADGRIVTSSFNFLGDPAAILVRLPDGRRLPARRVADDRSRMLTLLRVEADGLTVPAAADPDGARVGDWAIGVGRTYSEEEPNLSVGIVSATGRIWGRAVQTDAKTSPANYGGPLVDVAGRVIGVIAPLSMDGGDEAAGTEWYDSGIGFAVPLAHVLGTLDRLESEGGLDPGKLGLTFEGGTLDAAPVIDVVRPQSPADRAGVKPGDRILSVAGRPIDRHDEVRLAIGPLYAGDDVDVRLSRDGDERTVTVTLAAELPAWNPGDLGVLPAVAEDDAEPVGGAEVAAVFPDSPAGRAGLRAGDVVTSAAGEPVATAADLRRIVGRRTPGAEIPLTVRNAAGDGRAVSVTLGERPATVPEFRDGDASGEELDADRTGGVTVEPPGFEPIPARIAPRPGRGGYSLILWLGGGGEGLERAGAAADRSGVILLTPRPSADDWTPVDLPRLTAALERVRETYPVAAGRIAVVGAGDAARPAWLIALRNRGTFRGLAVTPDGTPDRLPENTPDEPLTVLLFGDPSAAADLRESGYPAASAPAADGGADAATLVRWAAMLDRI